MDSTQPIYCTIFLPIGHVVSHICSTYTFATNKLPEIYSRLTKYIFIWATLKMNAVSVINIFESANLSEKESRTYRLWRHKILHYKPLVRNLKQQLTYYPGKQLSFSIYKHELKWLPLPPGYFSPQLAASNGNRDRIFPISMTSALSKSPWSQDSFQAYCRILESFFLTHGIYHVYNKPCNIHRYCAAPLTHMYTEWWFSFYVPIKSSQKHTDASP